MKNPFVPPADATPLPFTNSMYRSAMEKAAPMHTDTSIDELQAIINTWVHTKHTRCNMVYYAPINYAIFAWGFVAGMSTLLRCKGIEAYHIPTPEGTLPSFVRGLSLYHKASDTTLTISTNYHEEHQSRQKAGHRHRGHPPPNGSHG